MCRWWVFALLLFMGGCLGAPAGDVSSIVPATESELSQTSAEVVSEPMVAQWDSWLPSASLWELPSSHNFASGQLAVLPPWRLEDFEAAEELQILEEETSPPEDEGQTVAAAPEEEAVTYDFPVVENDKVRYFIDYYTTGNGRKVFTRWLERSSRYLPRMREIFGEEGLPLDLAYLALVESGFNPRAYSWAHAAGPWQFIPSTGLMFGLDNDWWLDERRDFEKSTRAAARFLKQLHDRFEGDWYLAVAGYNAGGGKISQAIRQYNSRDFWEICHGNYLQAETKNYVPKLLATLLIAKQPEKYGFDNLQYQEPLVFEKVTVPTATDLEIVAELCSVSYETIKELNPELKRWCTPPGVNDYRLRIPSGSGEVFSEKYAAIPETERANYLRHQIRQGDTLLALAKRYRIRVDDIIALNNIHNPRALRIGTDLILPLSKNYNRLAIEELKDDYNRSRRRTYTVRQGDSLWKISRRFGVTEKQLRVWNRLGWENIIRPGQRLVVSSNAAAAPSKVVSGSDGQRKIVYHVRPGDTLWAIGRQFDVPTRKIMYWNQIDEDHVLRPGDKLTLLVGSGNQG